MSLVRQRYETLKSKVRLGLFSRSFLLLGVLMMVSLGAWLEVFFSMEEGPRAIQMAQRVSTSLSITRSALIYASPNTRTDLLLDLATKESLRIQPRETADTLEPLPNSNYWNHVTAEIKNRMGTGVLIMWSVNGMPGVWVSFEIEDEKFWLVFDREQLGLVVGVEWFWWGVTALLLALVGSAVSARFVNRPLAQLARVTQQLSRGEIPSPLPEEGPAEIKEINIAFNRMTKDLRQTEADREIMLAGISHDLRTPLARMRLEIEMSDVSDETRQAIDQDLAQIDYTIGQLMEYARPASSPPGIGVDITQALEDLYDREKAHTESLNGHLDADIAPNLKARIAAIDLKRIVGNLIENARRYGRSPIDGTCYIDLNARIENDKVIIEVADRGAGIAPSEVQRLLRPFSRGETARTGVSGAGLGLAIVERLLGHVGGKLRLLPRTPTGLLARIELPRA